MVYCLNKTYIHCFDDSPRLSLLHGIVTFHDVITSCILADKNMKQLWCFSLEAYLQDKVQNLRDLNLLLQVHPHVVIHVWFCLKWSKTDISTFLVTCYPKMNRLNEKCRRKTVSAWECTKLHYFVPFFCSMHAGN